MVKRILRAEPKLEAPAFDLLLPITLPIAGCVPLCHTCSAIAGEHQRTSCAVLLLPLFLFLLALDARRTSSRNSRFSSCRLCRPLSSCVLLVATSFFASSSFTSRARCTRKGRVAESTASSDAAAKRSPRSVASCGRSAAARAPQRCPAASGPLHGSMHVARRCA